MAVSVDNIEEDIVKYIYCEIDKKDGFLHMEPVRVLHVVGRMDRGGIETMIMNVYRHIDRERIQFDFLAHYGKPDADYNEEIRALGGRIYEMPRIKSTTKTYYNKFFEYRRALKDFFTEHQEYNIIHGHMTNTASIYMPIAKKYGNVGCCIAHSHSEHSAGGLTGMLSDILSKGITRYATDWFACSYTAAKWFYSKKDVDEGKVKIVTNGIDTQKFAYSPEVRERKRAELGLQDNFVIGNVARFFPPKNQNFLVSAMPCILEHMPEAVICFVGDGRDMPEAINLAKELGVYDKIRFLGLRSDVNELMQAFDVFAMPSFFEGLPLVGVEAQSAGLPCVFSDGITKEADLTGNVYYLPLADGEEKWARKIVSLKDFDRRDMSAKVTAAGYDIQTTTDFLTEFYLSRAAK